MTDDGFLHVAINILFLNRAILKMSAAALHDEREYGPREAFLEPKRASIVMPSTDVALLVLSSRKGIRLMFFFFFIYFLFLFQKKEKKEEKVMKEKEIHEPRFISFRRLHFLSAIYEMACIRRSTDRSHQMAI